MNISDQVEAFLIRTLRAAKFGSIRRLKVTANGVTVSDEVCQEIIIVVEPHSQTIAVWKDELPHIPYSLDTWACVITYLNMWMHLYINEWSPQDL